MGGAVSQGVDNDDIINKLKGANYIKTAQVEKVFRLVDRGYYILDEDRRSYAYKDTAWRRGNLHLSAPCIYAQVLEALQLEKGMSFLNLGSGTGYLSTMAGLILGPYGMNHGVELHGDVIAYAREKLENFLIESGAVDVLDFCKPQFIQGNAYLLDENIQKYDRVYCGAALLSTTQDMMQNFLKIGGIIVMPVSDQLLQIERTAETLFNIKSLLPVSFSSLIRSSPEYHDKTVLLPPSEILPMQEMCRLVIRQRLRDNVQKSNTELEPALIRKVVEPDPIYFPNYSSETDDMSDGDPPISLSSREDQLNALLDLATTFPMMRGLRNKSRILFSRESLLEATDEGTSSPSLTPYEENIDHQNSDNQSQEESVIASAPELQCSRQEAGASAVIERSQEQEENCSREDNEDDVPSILNETFDLCLKTTETALKRGLSESSAGEENAHASSHSSQKSNSDHKALKREKFDSGIGDEADTDAVLDQSSSSDSDLYDVSDSDSDHIYKSLVFANLRRRGLRRRSDGTKHCKRRRCTDRNKCHHSTDRLTTATRFSQSSAVPVKKYSDLMTASINKLPLPVPLKIFINYNRNL